MGGRAHTHILITKNTYEIVERQKDATLSILYGGASMTFFSSITDILSLAVAMVFCKTMAQREKILHSR